MKVVKKISAIFSWILVTAICLLAAALVLSNFNTPIKLRVFSVMSGSMEPALPTGSLVFVVNKNDYQKGDIVTVRSKAGGKETVTHRIDEVVNNDETDVTMYELKGDANKIKDSEPVNKNRVLGRVVGHVPYAGRVVGFAQTQMGFVFLVVVPCTLIIYSELMTIKKELLLLIKKRRAGVSVPPPAVPAT